MSSRLINLNERFTTNSKTVFDDDFGFNQSKSVTFEGKIHTPGRQGLK